MKDLIICGAGGLGREVLSIIRSLPEWNILGFVDDEREVNSEIQGYSVLGNINFLNKISSLIYVIIALGDPKVKERLSAFLTNSHIRFPIIIHPSAVIQHITSVQIGIGSVICAGVILTTDIRIGNHVLININSTVGHDCSLEDFCSVMPGVNIAGGVKIGKKVLVGSGSNIINKVSLGDESTVGMGSVVTKNVAQGAVVAGVPAIPLNK
jgi:sugar O-acyltransferase (sialic acid O-acetyltransferase NeuD family)